MRRLKFGIGCVVVELRREHRRFCGRRPRRHAWLERPIVIMLKTPRESSRLGGESCGCIMIGANTSTPMLTTVPLNPVGHANDRQRLAVEVKRLADDRRIGGERAAPQRR